MNKFAWLAVNEDGEEIIYWYRPHRERSIGQFECSYSDRLYASWFFPLPKGTSEKILGYKLDWNNSPVRITSKK